VLIILQNFLGFGQTADIDIVFLDTENRKYAECRIDESGKKEKLLLYYDGETISGKVNRRIHPQNTALNSYSYVYNFIIAVSGEEKTPHTNLNLNLSSFLALLTSCYQLFITINAIMLIICVCSLFYILNYF
jgi:hypothetical protein